MISSIPEDQLCQAFDPILLIPGKVDNIVPRGHEVFSCKAPAFVYMEGSHGKRFLCDFHYFYEKDMTIIRHPKEWSEVEQYLVDNLEQIKDTFGDTSSLTENEINLIRSNPCWCGAKAHVLTINKRNDKIITYFCSFHYRKIFYRYHTHGKNYLDTVIAKDARKILHDMSIREEAAKLPGV